jgi:long-chain fatty acid transport protein
MSYSKRNVVLALAVAAAVAAPSARATNGYFAHGYSIKEKGLAGSGVAMAQDSMAAATNPAGMVMVGNRMDLGASLFSPSPRSYTATPPTGAGFAANGDGSSVESDNDFFLIPHFGRNWMLDANRAVGITVYGNGGMNTEWPASNTPGGVGTFGNPMVPFDAGSAGVNLAQLFINGSYSQKFSPNASWGGSIIFAYQRFKATGVSGFGVISNDPSNLSDRGNDSSTGFGAKLGVQGEVSPGVTLGASYQSKIAMGEFDKYKGLFAENGDFDIPSTWTVGLAWKTPIGSDLTFDIQRINYTDVKAVSNPFRKLDTCAGTGPTCLGGSDGIGFGWEDMTIYKLGYQWKTGADWTWRVGYSQGDQPIPNTEVLFNILAPGVIEKHFTFGFTNQMSKTSELNFAAMIAPEKKISGSPSSGSIAGAPGQTVELKMKQFEIGASWGWKF